MRRTAEVFGLPIFSIADGREVGNITDVIFDADKRRVALLRVAPVDGDTRIKVLPFSLIESVGDDAIIIQDLKLIYNASQREEVQGLLESNVRGKGTKVLNRAGKFVGVVTEIVFDDETGRIDSFEVARTDTQEVFRISTDSILSFSKEILIFEEGAAARAPRPVWLPEAEERKKELIVEEEITEAPAPPKEEVREEIPPSPETEVTTEGGAPPKDLNEIFEEHQAALILGKNASQDLLDDAGNLIVSAGETVTEEVIQNAKTAGKFIPLLMNIDLKAK